jgi:RNA polymerase sigma-70 factor, ECF subfamily
MPGADARTDQQLVEAANRGDASAMETLYLRHREWVLSLALRFTHDHEAALDVMQETFVYLLGKFPGLVLRARLTTLLYPAVKNIALARRRRKRAGELDIDPASTDAGPTVDPDAARSDLSAAVSQLPEAQREVLLMRVLDSMSLSEVSVALGIPEGTVKSRLHHALAALREDPRTRRQFGG